MASSTMASQSLKPLLYPHRATRFLISRQKLPHKWNIINNHAYTLVRFSIFTHYSLPSLYSSLPLCPASLPPPRPLRSLFRPRLHHLRSPLTSMSTPQASSDPPSQSPSTKTVRVVVKGRVQGVFYRNWTKENANQLGLKGWVRNRRDGSVEALFSGDSDNVQEMEQRCRRGPPDAMVTGLQVFPCNDDPGTVFQLKPTV